MILQLSFAQASATGPREENQDALRVVTPPAGLAASKGHLFAIADGSGPAQHLITLGYAGWEAGQLEAELADNAWLTCPADPAVLFEVPAEQRLSAAAERLGVNLSLLTAQAGHA